MDRATCVGVELRPWPDDFLQKKAGVGCPQCALGRAAETEHGVRFYAGGVADGYLQRRGPTPGYSVVIFRGRHVGEPQAMTRDEHASFWSEVSTVAAAIAAVYEPIHLNFQILGNQDPHVHVHIVARFDPDPAPSLPLPAEAWENGHVWSREELAYQVTRLMAAMRR
jgi:diadenosine tetraphosphate (Ap4A) HIT family hydrolase